MKFYQISIAGQTGPKAARYFTTKKEALDHANEQARLNRRTIYKVYKRTTRGTRRPSAAMVVDAMNAAIFTPRVRFSRQEQIGSVMWIDDDNAPFFMDY